MKSVTFATVFAVAITAVSAQLNMADIPACATTCALTSMSGTQCSPIDFECICKDSKFINQLAPCISTVCSEADQQKMIEMATGLCSAYGVTIPPNVLDGASNGTANGTITTRPGSPTTSTEPGTTSSTAGAVRMVGSGFVAAAMGAAMIVL